MFSKVHYVAMVLVALFPLTTIAGSLLPGKVKRGLQGGHTAGAERPSRRLASPEDIFLRNLQLADCELGDFLTCIAEDEGYESCGWIGERKDGQWCYDSLLGEICCGNFSDCCNLKPGATAGLSIAFVAVIVLIVVASCACCSCCPWHDKLCCSKRNTSTDAAPAQAVYSGAATPPSPTPPEMPTASATEIKANPY